MKPLATITILLFSHVALLADTKVFLPDPERFARDGKEFLVTTTIPGDFTTPEGIVAALLILGDQAVDTKLKAPFSPKSIASTSPGKDALPLSSYYRGVKLRGETIVVSFSDGAMRYLNNTVSIQQFVKGSIEKTLMLHFPTVKTIEYEIDGAIVSEWDA